ncbi:MAG: hypothetical protein NUV73_02730 [Candidatus Daviesbacteria bacterium]|nr:hypothetical protein [Candidatus Daviesbacteria bacterium]
MRILIFLHGILIKHKDKDSIVDYANYIPVGNAVEKLKKWQSQGAEILYLSSHENQEDIEKDKLVLERYNFPEGEIYWRKNRARYADVAERIMPDILIEDDCESIGGEKEMVYSDIKPELKARIKHIVVKEFEGINHLQDRVEILAEKD